MLFILARRSGIPGKYFTGLAAPNHVVDRLYLRAGRSDIEFKYDEQL